MPFLYQQSKTSPLPEATWGILILVVCNKAAREQLITDNPFRLEKTKQDLSPAAIWMDFKKRRHHTCCLIANPKDTAKDGKNV